jgi:hypothetical protein
MAITSTRDGSGVSAAGAASAFAGAGSSSETTAGLSRLAQPASAVESKSAGTAQRKAERFIMRTPETS